MILTSVTISLDLLKSTRLCVSVVVVTVGVPAAAVHVVITVVVVLVIFVGVDTVMEDCFAILFVITFPMTKKLFPMLSVLSSLIHCYFLSMPYSLFVVSSLR